MDGFFSEIPLEGKKKGESDEGGVKNGEGKTEKLKIDKRKQLSEGISFIWVHLQAPFGYPHCSNSPCTGHDW